MRNRAFLAFVSLWISASAFAGLAVRFETDGVVVSGATRGGNVACIFADRIPQLWRNGSFVLSDSDGDGQLRLPDTKGFSKRTVWASVDVETGEYTVTSPGGAVAEIGFRGHTLKGNGAGQLKRLESIDAQALDILLVRPRQGAWALRTGDGSRGDTDGETNRRFALDIESLEPLHGYGPPPKHFEKGDVIVIIDPYTGAAFAMTVGK
jgi:hypothetical protein